MANLFLQCIAVPTYKDKPLQLTGGLLQILSERMGHKYANIGSLVVSASAL